MSGIAGGAVTMEPKVNAGTNPSAVSWMKGKDLVAEWDQSLWFAPGLQGRAELDSATGRLTLIKLQQNDSGEYTADILVGGKIQCTLFSLQVLGPESLVRPHSCTDFQPASFLRGSKLHVQFLLFTSSHPSCGQLLSSTEDIWNSSFNASLAARIVIHGFRALGTKPSWIDGLIGALLEAAPANVIAVDWVHGSTASYNTAVENVTELGLEISAFIQKLLALGVPETSIHLIGVSLGAHVGGLVGQFYKGRLGRITGLDPAGPKYTRASKEERLDPEDALFVEAIHTDTDKFGIRIPVGHIDYYVNGGQDQPGCPRFITPGYNTMICDHMRAVYFYKSALEDSCPLMAFPCSSYRDFLAGHCVYCTDSSLASCPTVGLLDNGGIDTKPLPREVKVYLATAASTPYCVHHSLVEVRLQQRRTSDTSIEINFWGRNSTFSITITVPKLETVGKSLAIHSTPLCQMERVAFLYHPKSWRRSKEADPVVHQFCAAPLPVDPSEKMFCLTQTMTLTGKNSPSYDLAMACPTTTAPPVDTETMTEPW
ncbi:PREDICTED: phospholipase A1 member A [Gekko japonicus]|uniref:Phospholipase A1 member A n=1 Tax=Gekko japonicus TaxID=146911 RepID=A0ABM1JVJ6_GEKJA|nr:PREDICTED: phospholipase A1 member A [Gekko japonicus]